MFDHIWPSLDSVRLQKVELQTEEEDPYYPVKANRVRQLELIKQLNPVKPVWEENREQKQDEHR